MHADSQGRLDDDRGAEQVSAGVFFCHHQPASGRSCGVPEY